MTLARASAINPLELAGAAFSSPLVSLVGALVIAGVVGLIATRTGRSAARGPAAEGRTLRTRYAPEHRALGIVALATLIVFLADFLIRTYVSGVGLAWWAFAVPLACAVIGVGVVFGIIATHGTTPPDSPIVPSARRTWLSFSSAPTLVVAGVALLALVSTSVAAGVASSPDDEGRYVWLTIPIPNEGDIDPIRVPFYGWTYSLPVLVCLAVLVAVTWATLDRNAARPYVKPETVAAERVARRTSARGTVRIMTAATLLALAAAWRLIAGAGSISTLTVMGQNGDAPYDAVWRFAELAVAAGWCAPVLEVIAFTLLLLVAATGLRRTRVANSSPTPAEPAQARATGGVR